MARAKNRSYGIFWKLNQNEELRLSKLIFETFEHSAKILWNYTYLDEKQGYSTNYKDIETTEIRKYRTPLFARHWRFVMELTFF